MWRKFVFIYCVCTFLQKKNTNTNTKKCILYMIICYRYLLFPYQFKFLLNINIPLYLSYFAVNTEQFTFVLLKFFFIRWGQHTVNIIFDLLLNGWLTGRKSALLRDKNIRISIKICISSYARV